MQCCACLRLPSKVCSMIPGLIFSSCNVIGVKGVKPVPYECKDFFLCFFLQLSVMTVVMIVVQETCNQFLN